jgi:hypothetical protein
LQLIGGVGGAQAQDQDGQQPQRLEAPDKENHRPDIAFHFDIPLVFSGLLMMGPVFKSMFLVSPRPYFPVICREF